MDNTLDSTFESANRVYDTDGLCPTIPTCGGGGIQPKIVDVQKVDYVEMRETVKVRKHDIDTTALCKLLREHKKIPNKEIAEKLDVQLTLVEHWFRTDKSFAIPSAEIWFKLKELLGISTDEFDKAITEFEERDGVFEKTRRVYLTDALSPTLTAETDGEKVMEIKKMEQCIVAMRGRNPDNPSDRTAGIELEQRLEPNTEGICNNLTTVQKDNLVLETEYVAYDEQNKCIREETFGTLTTDGSSPKHNNRVIESKKIKIRQATKDGFIECEIGGGRRPGLSIIPHTQRASNRERKDMPNVDNGDYP